ncbi:Aromatic amino acid lyase [Parasponia andersonii]|uniref:phenylalanine ammonia-lyase n=1 Tax=Parasponia andersonii TaxID=3476 RepID=A0A2P5C1H1_PARAD|nr:Aromatic amino acid lyase [Parasponia andersonii]
MASKETCYLSPNPSPHWHKASSALQCSHFDEVRRMLNQFANAETIEIQGTTLTVAQVTAVSRRAEVKVTIDEAAVRRRVTDSANWVSDHISRGTDTYGVTTGFGATSHRRTDKAGDLQTELIRFLNAGVVGKDHLPANYSKAAMLVRTNTLMQGYSGIRWELLQAIEKLMNQNLIPKLPLRGTVTASGDLVPLSYIAGLLTGRHNSKVSTLNGEEIKALEALNRAGISSPFELQAKEGLALVNGTAVGSSVAAIVCFDANLLAVLSEILSALFSEAIQGHRFADSRVEAPPGSDRVSGCDEDRYALRTSPRWLGPQVEVIRMATHSIEREINSVNDNPLIVVSRDLALHGGNFQGIPIGVCMDNLRIAIAAIGKLMFAQFSELVSEYYNNGLPSNLSGGPNPSLDYGGEAIEILKLMSATFMVALCQAIDLRHTEENMREAIKQVVNQTVKKTVYADEKGSLLESRFCEKELIQIVEHQPFFSSLDDPTNPAYGLVMRLREVVVERALGSDHGEESGSEMGYCFQENPSFMEELKARLGEETKKGREKFDGGDFLIGNRIKNCRTYPVYEFVRSEVGTELLRGGRRVSPGEDIEKVYDAVNGGKLGGVVMNCRKGWDGSV